MASSLVDSNVRPHDRFFFSDGSLYLLVENSLYCVHKSFFEIHASMFPIHDLETSLSKPYVLEGVKKSDFDRFLANIYPRALGVEETKTTQDWISVLGLASKWGFESLRSKAISKIEQTLDSPIDMVILGRQYGIPDILLPGYAVLCQCTIPLSHKDGLRLGIEDVVNIYRIRHELYGSGITPVPFEVAFAKVKEAGLGTGRPRQELDGEQASTWTDAGSVAAPEMSTEIEGTGTITLTLDVNPPSSEVASTDAAALVFEKPEHRHVDVHSPIDKPTSVALDKGGSDVPSSVFSGNVSNLDSESSEPDRDEGFKLFDELTAQNCNIVSVEIIQWANTKDIQTLHQITRLIVEKAIKASEVSNDFPRNPFLARDPFARLCKAMVKYTQTLHQMSRLLVEKAMEEPHRIYACAQLCNMMMKDIKNDFGLAVTITAGGLLFREYLGEICQQNLAASVAAAGELTARIRRLRLIDFIGTLAAMQAISIWAPTTIDKWMTAFLDPDDEEKVATLCMLMTRASQVHCSDTDNWLQRVKDVAKKTSKPRVRKLLQGVSMTERNSTNVMSWIVAEPSEDCTVQ